MEKDIAEIKYDNLFSMNSDKHLYRKQNKRKSRKGARLAQKRMNDIKKQENVWWIKNTDDDGIHLKQLHTEIKKMCKKFSNEKIRNVPIGDEEDYFTHRKSNFYKRIYQY